MIPPALDAFLNHMKNAHDDLTFTVEDKDVNIVWGHLGVALVYRWFGIMLQDESRWRVETMTINECVAQYRKLLADFAPRFLKDKTGFFDIDQIPVAHMSVKRKCYKEDSDIKVCNGVTIPTTIPHT
eukprot:10138291-Karenia_brevis.AAC.1